jgi:hypothetical protein
VEEHPCQQRTRKPDAHTPESGCPVAALVSCTGAQPGGFSRVTTGMQPLSLVINVSWVLLLVPSVRTVCPYYSSIKPPTVGQIHRAMGPAEDDMQNSYDPL